MSYEIVKGIKIKDNKVFIDSHSNNDTTPSQEVEYPYFTKILQEQGKQELDIALLRNYEEGNLQGGSNKYARALKVLFYLFKDEYFKFNWRNDNSPYGSEEHKQFNLRRESQAFKDLLLKALNTKMPKKKYIVFNSVRGYYVWKVTTRHIFYTNDIQNAKRFDFEEQARQTAEYIKGEVKIFDEMKGGYS